MGTHGDTRRAAYAAACDLAAAGERPSVAAIRARLAGRGGQQAIQAGLNDWLQEAARRFQLPALPAALQETVITLWQAACQTAATEWEGERTALKQAVEEGAQARLAWEGAYQATHLALDRCQSQLRTTQADLFAQQHTARSALEQVEALTQQWHDAQRQIDALAQRSETQTARIATLEQVIGQAQAALEQARTEQRQWQERAVTAETAVTRLEQVAADRARQRAELDATLQDARAEQARQQQALDERDAQIQTLTGLLERTQATQEAESGRWLMQIDEQRQALAAARDRERRSEQERGNLLREVQALTQALRTRVDLLSKEAGASTTD